jgi:hypothetical protein
MLPMQLEYTSHSNNVSLAAGQVFKHWVNIKKAFTKQYKKFAGGMTDMLDYLGLELEGKHHSGEWAVPERQGVVASLYIDVFLA